MSEVAAWPCDNGERLTVADLEKRLESYAKVLGPLLDCTGFRPLAFEGARLVVAELASDDPALHALLGDARVVVGPPPPRLDHAAFMSLIQVGVREWVCWDRDERRFTVIVAEIEGEDLQHREVRLAPLAIGPLPLLGMAAPSTPLAHAAARGEGWAAGVHAAKRMHPQVLTRPPNAVAVLLPHDENKGDSGDGTAWRFVQQPERVFESGSDVASGSLMTLEWTAENRLRVRWAGEHRLYRLRAGTLEILAHEHTLAPHYPQVIARCIGSEPEELDLELEPDDRFLVCTEATWACFEEVGQLLAGDLREAANRIQLALRQRQATDAALVFGARPTFAHSSPGWFPRVAVQLEPKAPQYDDLHGELAPEKHPQRYTVYRGATSMRSAPVRSVAEWNEALAEALARDLVAERFDAVTVWIHRRHVLCLQFDGAAWVPVGEPGGGQIVASGQLSFPEERLAPALEAVVEGVAHGGYAATLEAEASRVGLVTLAHWLSLEREHAEGGAGVGLLEARTRISRKVRARLDRLRFTAMPVAHRVDVRQIRKELTRYDRCLLEYRSCAVQQFEGNSTAGAWWNFSWGGASYRRHATVRDLRAFWRCDGLTKLGHMGAWNAEATGDGTPFALCRPPRMVREDELLGARPGVPLRVMLTVECGQHLIWTWRGAEVEPPADADRELRGRIRMDAIVLQLERLVVFEVLSAEPA